LDHQSILASGKKMINFEMPFPPGKKLFDVPAKLIYKRHILGGLYETPFLRSSLR